MEHCLIKHFYIAKIPKYYGYQQGLVLMVYKFFHKKIFSGGIRNENISKKELAEELHKAVIRKFEKRNVH